MSVFAISISDDLLEARLRARAAAHNTSIEDEALHLLRAALVPADEGRERKNLAQAIRDRFEPLGGVELDLDWIRKLPSREPPTFD